MVKRSSNKFNFNPYITKMISLLIFVIVLAQSSLIINSGYDLTLLAGGSDYNSDFRKNSGSPGARSFTLGVDIGPNQTSYGRFGDTIDYNLTVYNNQTVPDYIDIQTRSGPSDWAVTVFESNGQSILRDSPGDGDGIPDTGLLAPLEFIFIIVKINIPHNQAFNVPEETVVTASSSLSPQPHEGRSELITKAFPHLDVTKSVSPVKIYEEEADLLGLNTRARVTLNIKGSGIPTMVERYHDVVFCIDNTGSMTLNDPNLVRLDAGNSYVNNMTYPDQGAVITFYGTAAFLRGNAWIARDPSGPVEHLTTNYKRLKDNINWTGTNIGGGTNILRALQLANNELLTYGNLEHIWYIILLTDGYDSGNFAPGDRDAAIRTEAQRAANNNIVIFTIGLGSDTNVQLLKDVANLTKGNYYEAQNASQLMDIYNQIQLSVSKVAGRDPDPNDDESMVKEVLPDYINIVPDSFRLEPGSINADPLPSRQYVSPTNTTLYWDIEKIMINQSWIVSFEITSKKVGWVPVGIYPEARVLYTDWANDTKYTIPFPDVWIEVLPVPLPDLVPTDITVNDVLYSELDGIQVLRGEMVTIGTKVVNNGIMSTSFFAGSFSVGFFNASNPQTPFHSPEIPKLDVDEISAEFNTTWQAPFTLGEIVLSIYADWKDDIPEGRTNENNNIFNFTISVVHIPFIDLQPREVHFDMINLTPPYLDVFEVEVKGEAKIELRVFNDGNENTNYYTSSFTVAIYNRSAPETPLSEEPIYSLTPGGLSRSIVFLWRAPDIPGMVELELEVDSKNSVPEGIQGELNNRIPITIRVMKDIFVDLQPYKLIINDNNQFENSAGIQVSVQRDYDLVIGQTAVITFQAVSFANEPTDFFSSDFSVTAFNITDPEGKYFFRTVIDNLEADTVSQSFTTTWQAPLEPGSYPVIIFIDNQNVIPEETLGEKNNIINIIFYVFDLPGAPDPALEVDKDKNDAVLAWDPVENAVKYRIFASLEPDEFDFKHPIAEVSTTLYRHTSATQVYQKYFYCIQAADEHGWFGPTGAVVGFYTKHFFEGYNTFSLPLEPFQVNRVSLYNDEMLEFDHEAIYYYNEELQQWMGHPKFLSNRIDNFELVMGKSYMLYSARDFDYTFTGRPETMIRFIQGPAGSELPGGDPGENDFRHSLKLSTRETGVFLEWSAIDTGENPGGQVKYYELYRKTERGGLDLNSSEDEDQSLPDLILISTTRITKFLDSEAFDLIERQRSTGLADREKLNAAADDVVSPWECHYIVIPISGLGLRGGSTYSASISIHELRTGYNSFGFSLIDSSRSSVFDFINSVGTMETDTLYYYDKSIENWLGHPGFLPDFRDNPIMQTGEGYLIFMLAETQKFYYEIT